MVVPVKVVFTCEVCGCPPGAETQRSLERQLLDLRHGEYVDAEPERWLVMARARDLRPHPLLVRESPRRAQGAAARAVRDARLAPVGQGAPPLGGPARHRPRAPAQAHARGRASAARRPALTQLFGRSRAGSYVPTRWSVPHWEPTRGGLALKRKQIGTMLAVASVAAAVGVAGGIAGGSAATGGNGAERRDGKAGGQAPPGRHIGPNGQRERPLSGDVAAQGPRRGAGEGRRRHDRTCRDRRRPRLTL